MAYFMENTVKSKPVHLYNDLIHVLFVQQFDYSRLVMIGDGATDLEVMAIH